MRDGKVYYHAVYFDQMTMMTQLRLVPERWFCWEPLWWAPASLQIER